MTSESDIRRNEVRKMIQAGRRMCDALSGYCASLARSWTGRPVGRAPSDSNEIPVHRLLAAVVAGGVMMFRVVLRHA